ncbi:leader peptidase (prepilin peptidase) / N-methyltransferase [Geodermatophilus pulveris]|uniref:Leader peptidase (Prepilin peptidase) / N-methyltransferase n=1 Tax=Geodermatophilus pulveris TaxID=1564159 RepID=A0A239EYF2_9ACTN|nr:prepilin peptidase [Geodermatophilus pulveris]SNS49617.1 leader peptidase (prepilin peptidase) / N-methyltransferase [Geodermatophilus pulveris]
MPPADLPPGAVAALAVAGALVLGPWLARVSVRLARRDDAARPGPRRTVLTTALVAAALAGALLVGGLRPGTVALAWAGAAGVVLGAVDLAAHRLPDRVTLPASAAVAAALLVDAAALGTWPALLRAALAGAAAFAVAALAAVLSPRGLGFGDVKLVGLLGLVLGWVGWGALLAGVFLGLLTGALASLALIATGRAGWRTALPFGPPLLVGAALALAVAGPLP